ncbi:hypothetical protein TNCV_599051 [Trichonephila clavipes]|nr:hypothetical protein TNCV_599051 [Trichonephila clavipes]
MLPDGREKVARESKSCISKMPFQQLLHWIYNIRNSTILHKNDRISTTMLLKIWNDVVVKKTLKALTSGGNGDRTKNTRLFEKVWPYDERSRKPAPHSDLCRMKWYWSSCE